MVDVGGYNDTTLFTPRFTQEELDCRRLVNYVKRNETQTQRRGYNTRTCPHRDHPLPPVPDRTDEYNHVKAHESLAWMNPHIGIRLNRRRSG